MQLRTSPCDAGWRISTGASTREVLEALAQDPVARAALTDAIAQVGAGAVFWECRPFDATTLDQSFEAMVLPAPGLARTRADPRPFARVLDGLRPPATATFANLSGDAVLVAPADPGTSPASHAHLAAFLRTAPSDLHHALWTAVAAAVRVRLERDPGPLWLSTCGLGVSWLHIRLDQRPKYITHRSYRLGPHRG